MRRSGIGGLVGLVVVALACAAVFLVGAGAAGPPPCPLLEPLASFGIDTPSSADAGTQFPFTVTALGADGCVVTDYAGTVHFTTSDTNVNVVLPGDYTFDGSEGGVQNFDATLATTPSQTLTVADEANSVSTQSAAIPVDPGQLARFAFEHIDDQTAGASFGGSVHAYDAYDNLKTDYSGSPLFTTTMNGSLIGCSVACSASAGSLDSFSEGSASFTGAVGYKAESSRSFTIKDGSVSKDSNPFAVGPGATLGRFGFEHVDDPTAGTSFSGSVNAYDTYDNLKTDYSGSPSLATTMNGSSIGCSGPCTASAGSLGAFAAGSASFTGAIGYKAESNRKLTAQDGSVSSDSNTFTVKPGPLARFAFDPAIPNQIAGSSFGGTTKAYDTYDNLKTNYSGSPSLTTTMHGSAIGCSGACTRNAGTLGAFSDGQASFSGAVGYTAESGRTITVLDQQGPGSGDDVSQTSSGFTVKAAQAASLAFSDPAVPFNGQPIDTKAGAPTYSKCVSPPASASNPCALPPASTPVQVLVRDRYGNLAINVTDFPISQVTLKPNGSLQTLQVVSMNGTTGIASFSNPNPISPATLGAYTLIASTTSPSLSTTSNSFQLVADLTACSGQKCENKAKTASGTQSVYGKATTGSAFDPTAVLLTSQFIGGTNFATTKCQGSYASVSDQNTEVKAFAQNGAIAATSPAFAVALIIPKATLQNKHVQNRAVKDFNACVGVTWMNQSASASPWTAKNIGTGALTPSVLIAGDYWGWAPDCTALSAAQRATGNPCVSTRTKDASILGPALGLTAAQVAALPFKSGDLAIVVVLAYPWDAKFGGP